MLGRFLSRLFRPPVEDRPDDISGDVVNVSKGLVEPEHSHRSPLSGRRPFHLFASDKPFHHGRVIGDD